LAANVTIAAVEADQGALTQEDKKQEI